MALQHIARTTLYTIKVEDSEDHYSSESRKGRLHYTKGILSDLTTSDY
jgi:hypothetical protein